jgi:hypothetical protein
MFEARITPEAKQIIERAIANHEGGKLSDAPLEAHSDSGQTYFKLDKYAASALISSSVNDAATTFMPSKP